MNCFSGKIAYAKGLQLLSTRYTLVYIMSRTPFTQRVMELIRSIPTGKVATYGGIARMAGSPRAARQVVRILHTCTQKEGLPWLRVINKRI